MPVTIIERCWQFLKKEPTNEPPSRYCSTGTEAVGRNSQPGRSGKLKDLMDAVATRN